MALLDSILAAVSSPGGLKEALGAALNRCEVGACVHDRNLSVGMKCVQCGKFCCNAHGFIPLSVVPTLVSQKRLAVVCQECVVLKAREEAPP